MAEDNDQSERRQSASFADSDNLKLDKGIKSKS